MKNHSLLLVGALFASSVLSGGAAIRWDGVHLETAFVSTTTAGGNVLQHPNPQGQLPAAVYLEDGQTRAVQLRDSAIGHAVAVSPVVTGALLAEGRRLLQEAVGYASVTDELADHQRDAGQRWNIRFPGVVDPQNINSNSFTFTDANFSPHLLVRDEGDGEGGLNAASLYRAALRSDPRNATAAHGLLRAYYERMAAFTFAGHNGAERAARVRLLFGDIGMEIAHLEQHTLSFYLQATDDLKLLTSRLLEAQLFDGSYPHLAAPLLAPNRNRLTEAYARALSHQAETLFHLGRLKHLNNYANPLLSNGVTPALNALAAEISGQRLRLAERDLLLDLPEETSLPTQVERGRVRNLLNRVETLESSILEGRVFFIAAHNEGTPTQPSITFDYREYAPDYVPFHALTSVGRSHEQFLEIAGTFLARAQSREAAAQGWVREFDTQQFALTNALKGIKDRYWDELARLCGVIHDESGQPVPDVVLALFPDDERIQLHTYGPGESRGEFALQWARIDQAGGEVDIAVQDLEAIYSQIDKKREVAGLIAEGIDNLARMFLENGEKLEGLDLESGRLQAEATIERAKAQRSSGGFLSGLKKAVSSVATMAVGAMTGNLASIPDALAKLTSGELMGKLKLGNLPLGPLGKLGLGAAGAGLSAHNSNGKSMKVARIDAKLQENLAAINAQRTRIATLERVAIQHQQRDQFLLQTEEAVHALLLQAERQKLAILLAEQRLGAELLALENLSARVHFLLQEYANAVALEQSNPLRSPDFRLVRDIGVREAESAFLLAHRWVYLAAKSVEYRVNAAAEATTLPNAIAGVLRVRNADSLEAAMANLNNTLNTFYEDQNREVTGLTPNHISFRHHLIQRNTLANEQDIAVAELQPGGLTSAEHWLQFLLAHTSTSNSGVRQQLVLPFATSLDNWPDSPDPRFINPLTARNNHNEVISGPGIEIQFLGTGLSLGGQNPRFRLEYLGASAMRQEICAVTGGKRVRYWNIRRPDGSPYETDGTPGVGTTSSWGSGAPGMNEFSPANDRWRLVIEREGNPGNAEILNQLEKVTDIRIRFWTSYFPSAACP